MKIQILSDLHLEFEYKVDGYKTDSDVIIIAGDFYVYRYDIFKSLIHFQDIYDKPIIFVPGNHEYYGTSKRKLDEEFSNFKENNIYILNDDYCKIDDVYFIGSTGWYDESNGLVYPSIRNMSDYYQIEDLIDNDNGVIWGRKSKKFFKEKLEVFKNEKTVCISHNGVINLPNERYKGDALNTCFFNNWIDLLEDYSPNYWIHGHTHTSINKKIINTEIVCNPKGYINENKEFNPKLCIEL